jgi:hypothetical protein
LKLHSLSVIEPLFFIPQPVTLLREVFIRRLNVILSPEYVNILFALKTEVNIVHVSNIYCATKSYTKKLYVLYIMSHITDTDMFRYISRHSQGSQNIRKTAEASHCLFSQVYGVVAIQFLCYLYRIKSLKSSAANPIVRHC